MKRKYDLVFSLGGSCKGSMSLREAGLQLLTFPLDWCGGPRLVEKADHICSDFDGFLSFDKLEKAPCLKTNQTQLYRDTRLGYLIIHEFRMNVPFEQEMPVVRERFRRRISRFLSLLDRAKTVLITWVNIPGAPAETRDEALEFIRRMRRRRPDTTFEMLLFNHVPGVTPANAVDRESDGVRIVDFDYENRKASADEWEADHHLLGKWLASEYEIDDYRTDAERAAWAAKQTNARFARFAAKNWLDYLVTKLQYKLYRHLAKRMERRGIA